MTKNNPMADDLGGGFFQTRQPPKKADKEPTTTYHEQDEHLWNLQAIYGDQEQKQRYREGRPIKEQQSWNRGVFADSADRIRAAARQQAGLPKKEQPDA